MAPRRTPTPPTDYTPPATSPSASNPSGGAQPGVGSGVTPALAPPTVTPEQDPGEETARAQVAIQLAIINDLDLTNRIKAAQDALQSAEQNPVITQPLQEKLNALRSQRTDALEAFSRWNSYLSDKLKERAANKDKTLSPAEIGRLQAEARAADADTELKQAQLRRERWQYVLETDPTSIEAKKALDQAKIDESKANTTYAAARTLSEQVNNAKTDAEIQALLAGLPYVAPQAAATVAGTEAGTTNTLATATKTGSETNRINVLLPYEVDQAKAQIAASQAQAAQAELDRHQKELGEAGALIESLAASQKAGLLTQAQADRILDDKLKGSTVFDRQKQRESMALQLSDQALARGVAVRPSQTYLVGDEPNGAYQQMFQKLGIAYTPTRLQPTALPKYAQSIGINLSPEGAAPSYFGPGGVLNQPAVIDGQYRVVPNDQAVNPQMVNSVAALPDWSGLHPSQVDALYSAPLVANAASAVAQPAVVAGR